MLDRVPVDAVVLRQIACTAAANKANNMADHTDRIRTQRQVFCFAPLVIDDVRHGDAFVWIRVEYFAQHRQNKRFEFLPRRYRHP